MVKRYPCKLIIIYILKYLYLFITIVLILWVNIFHVTDHYIFRGGERRGFGKLVEKKSCKGSNGAFLYNVKKKNNVPENAHSPLSLKKMVCPLAGVRWVGNLYSDCVTERSNVQGCT